MHIVSYIYISILSTSENIVTEFNKGEKLNNDNHEIWSMKFQYALKEKEAIEALNVVMRVPE